MEFMGFIEAFDSRMLACLHTGWAVRSISSTLHLHRMSGV